MKNKTPAIKKGWEAGYGPTTTCPETNHGSGLMFVTFVAKWPMEKAIWERGLKLKIHISMWVNTAYKIITSHTCLHWSHKCKQKCSIAQPKAEKSINKGESSANTEAR